MQPKYLNPYTDFGFKKLFGEETSKDLLLDFLNQILPAHHQIASLQFKNTENLPDLEVERKAIFDIYCTSVTGERFIVEMQKAKIQFFKDRSLYYATYPIRDQAEVGGWSFKLAPVYFIAILDFIYDENRESRKFRRDVVLKDQDGNVFFDKLQFTFLQMPLFNKREGELETKFDKWIFFLKNLETFDHIPQILNEPVFEKGFDIAELAKLDPDLREYYEKSRLAYWDLKNVADTAIAEGLAKGFAQGIEQGIEQGRAVGVTEAKLEVARNLKAKGFDALTIAELTGLTMNEIKQSD